MVCNDGVGVEEVEAVESESELTPFSDVINLDSTPNLEGVLAVPKEVFFPPPTSPPILQISWRG